MRNLTLTFFLAIVLHLVVVVAVASALPQCTDPSYRHNCEGTYTFAEGDKYVGAFRDHKFHGQGTYYHLADNHFKGDKYVGPYKDDKRHGQGKFILADGHTAEGIWEANKFLYAQKAPASGENIKEEIAEAMRFANANLVPEIIECAVFYGIVGQGEHETATKLQKTSAFLMEFGYLLAKSINMKEETLRSMVDQYSAEMIQAVDADLINIRILLNKHGKFCKKLATNQTDRLEYWFQKEINR